MNPRTITVARCAVLVGIGLAVAACGSGDGPITTDTPAGSAPVTGSVAPPTLPASTIGSTLPSTTAAAPTTTIEPFVVDLFEPDCVERGPSRPARPVDSTGLEEFGPLGPEPVVQVALPRVPSAPNNDWARAGVFVVPGGMLLALSPYDGMTEAGMVTLVDDDGTVRWVRCLADRLPLIRVAPEGDGGELATMQVTYDANGPATSRVEMWSLADGQVTRTLDEVLADNGIEPLGDTVLSPVHDVGNRLLVLGRSSSEPVTETDRLYVVDLSTGTATSLTYPPTALGMTPDSVVMTSVDGRLAHTADLPSMNAGRLVAVQDGGSWSTDPADLDAARPARTGFLYSEGMALFAVDGSGDELWRRTDYLAVPAEGFATAVSDGVVLARVCTGLPTADGSDWCPGSRMVGVDAATGRTLWEREGWWDASVVADGRAMMAGPFGGESTGTPAPVPWVLVDLRTGDQVGTQTWSVPWRFGIGCCDSPEGVFWSGGVVITSDEDTVELWYPAARSTALATVDVGVE